MNTYTKFIKIGVVLVLCLPAFVVVAGIAAYLFPRQYYSSTALEVRADNPSAFLQAFQVAARPYHESVEIRQVRNTSLYEIGVFDTNREHAAEIANLIATNIIAKLNDAPPLNSSSSDPRSAAIQALARGPVVTIHQYAEPMDAPSRPNFPVIICLGIGAGIIFAFCGAILIVIGIVSRADRLPGIVKVG